MRDDSAVSWLVAMCTIHHASALRYRDDGCHPNRICYAQPRIVLDCENPIGYLNKIHGPCLRGVHSLRTCVLLGYDRGSSFHVHNHIVFEHLDTCHRTTQYSGQHIS
ncbi:hypothetical protein QCA50_014869 [Cerrena zonata]|uniref:Secreted protein n=1 Tax=Cerrena zonata TaxID=2478898 RepID=A0AAW0FP36_9APHY